MAKTGVSMAETSRIILKSDPSHPDNIEDAVKAHIDEFSDKKPSDKQVDEIRANIKKERGAPTVYIVGPLTLDDRIEIGDLDNQMTQTANGITMTMRHTERAYKTVQRALRGWENYLDGKNRPINFKFETASVHGRMRQVASEDSLASMPKEDIYELANEIASLNGMRTDLEKKLEGLSTLQVTTPSETGGAQTKNAPQTNESSVAADSPQP